MSPGTGSHRLDLRVSRPEKAGASSSSFSAAVPRSHSDPMLRRGLRGYPQQRAGQGSQTQRGAPSRLLDLDSNAGWVDEVKSLFRRADLDSDGLVDQPQLRLLLRELGVSNVSDADLRHHFRALDSDRDQRLDIKEFVELLSRIGCEQMLLDRVSKKASAIKDQEDTLHCPLCFSPFRHQVVTPCEHKFCLECINLWYWSRKNCPMCRRDLSGWSPAEEQADSRGSTQLPPQQGFWQPSPRQLALRQAEIQQEEELEQDRILGLVPLSKAFVLRLGYRTMGSTRQNATLFVEPVIPGLPLFCLVQEVAFELHPQLEDQRPQRVRARGPLFELSRPRRQLDPSFTVHILFKEGLGMARVTTTVQPRSSASASSRCVAVELPEANGEADPRVRGDLTTFKKVLRMGGRRSESRGTM